jgi:hypothetical protein
VHAPSCVSIRQHMSAYVSIRQHTSAYAPEWCIRRVVSLFATASVYFKDVIVLLQATTYVSSYSTYYYMLLHTCSHTPHSTRSYYIRVLILHMLEEATTYVCSYAAYDCICVLRCRRCLCGMSGQALQLRVVPAYSRAVMSETLWLRVRFYRFLSTVESCH